MSAEEKWRIFRDEMLRTMYTFDAWASGILVVEHANGGAEIVTKTMSEADLLAIRRQCNQALLDACNRHKREFAMLAGESIEPQVHFGAAHVTAVAGA